MKMIKLVLGSLLSLLLIILLALWAFPPELLRIGANYSAKVVCSNVFLANRDPEDVLRTDVQAPGAYILRYMKVSVDRDSGVVRAGFFGFIGSGLAVARPGAGCTAVPDGNLSLAKAAVPMAAAAAGPAAPAESAPVSPPAPVLWPDGEATAGHMQIERAISDNALVGPGMRAIVVVDHGRITAERYGAGITSQTPLLGWSMSKTVIAGLIGMLVKDGKLTLDQAGFWPAGDGREHIRIADLLAMSSGLRFNEAYGAVSDITRMLYLRPDMAAFAHDQPLAHPVGEFWGYSSGTALVLSRILQQAAGSADFASQRLFKPLGMRSAVLEADEHGTPVGSSYMYATAHDWARYGQFLLQDGVWKDSRLLPEGYVAMMATPVKASKGEYGQGLTWLWKAEAAKPFGIPPDAFYLSGHDGQRMVVIRSRQLVILRLGLTPAAGGYSPEPLIKAVLAAT